MSRSSCSRGSKDRGKDYPTNTWRNCKREEDAACLPTPCNSSTCFKVSSAPPRSASRLRDLMDQADVLGLAKFVSECLGCYD
eukprot:632529-Pelagomonas_calceolata.AAC.1